MGQHWVPDGNGGFIESSDGGGGFPCGLILVLIGIAIVGSILNLIPVWISSIIGPTALASGYELLMSVLGVAMVGSWIVVVLCLIGVCVLFVVKQFKKK